MGSLTPSQPVILLCYIKSHQGRDFPSETRGQMETCVCGGGGGKNRFYNSLCMISLIRRTQNVKKK